MELMNIDLEKPDGERSGQAVHKSTDWGSISLFIIQVVVVCTVTFAAAYNLTVNPDSNHDIWVALLGTVFGHMLPRLPIKSQKQTSNKQK